MNEGKRIPRSERWNQPQGRRGTAFGRFCRRHAFRPGRVLILLLVLLLLLGALLWLGGSRLAVSSRITEMGLRNIGEMATQAGYFTSVQTIEKSRDVFGIEVPGTRSNYVYSYDGDIKAGLDFQEVRVDVNELTRVITVHLPEIRILSAEAERAGNRDSERNSGERQGQRGDADQELSGLRDGFERVYRPV